MIFDIVQMRREGRKRLRADLLQQLPVRGEVTTQDTGAKSGLIASLTVDGNLLWRLSQCRVTRITAGGLVLAGIEETPDGLSQRQAWWCRLPGPGAPRPYDPNPSSVVARDLSYAPV